MSKAEICQLTLKDLFEAINLDIYPETLEELIDRLDQMTDIIPVWCIIRVKTGNKFFTFSSPEAFYAIIDYLKELKRKVENPDKRTRNAEYIFAPETNLFLSKVYTPLSVFTLGKYYTRLNEKAGFGTVNGVAFFRSHILRKIFASTLEKYKMPYLMTRRIMGHKIDKTTSAYFKADPQTIKEEYILILDHLTTNQVKIKNVPSERLDQVIKDSESKDKQMALMERKMEEMEKRNKERYEFLEDLMTKKKVVEKIFEDEK